MPSPPSNVSWPPSLVKTCSGPRRTVADAADQGVVAVAAAQDVVAQAADKVSLPAPPSSDVGADPSSQSAVDVVAEQHVVAGAADQRVAATLPISDVGRRAADQAVGRRVAAAGCWPNVAEPMTFSMLVIVSVPPEVPVFCAVDRVQVDRHGRGRGGIVDRVRTARAVVGVGAAAVEEDVVVAVAGDVVGARAGADVLEAGDGVVAARRWLGGRVARLTVTAGRAAGTPRCRCPRRRRGCRRRGRRR